MRDSADLLAEPSRPCVGCGWCQHLRPISFHTSHQTWKASEDYYPSGHCKQQPSEFVSQDPDRQKAWRTERRARAPQYDPSWVHLTVDKKSRRITLYNDYTSTVKSSSLRRGGSCAGLHHEIPSACECYGAAPSPLARRGSCGGGCRGCSSNGSEI